MLVRILRGQAEQRFNSAFKEKFKTRIKSISAFRNN